VPAGKDYLLLFLEKRIFTLGAADDNLLKMLRASVDTVVSAMENDFNLVIPFSLVALDAETPADDPVFGTVAMAVQEQWNTYTERFADVPRTLFRAILLDALRRLAENNIEVAGALDLLCRNLIKTLRAGGEAPILEDFAQKMFTVAQPEADKHWSMALNDSKVRIPVLKLGPLDSHEISVNREHLRQAFQTPNWNQHNWQNKPDLLQQHLLSQGVEKIAEIVEAAVKAGGVSADDLKKNVADPIRAALKEALETVSHIAIVTQSPVQTLRRQIDLLWWKEAAFSETLKLSYRSIPRALLAITFAIDLAALVPPWSPLGVERFLAQAFWVEFASDRREAESEKLLTDQYLKRIKEDQSASSIFNRLPVEVDKSSGRSTLISFLSDFIDNRVDLKHLERRTGLHPSIDVNEPEICARVFREIQALRLLKLERNGAAE
jgi:hypothetical protein